MPLLLPLAAHRVPAGFPSPATDYLEDGLDLNAYLVQHPAATFLFSVQGHSMQGAGIMDGDKVVVDRSITPPWPYRGCRGGPRIHPQAAAPQRPAHRAAP